MKCRTGCPKIKRRFKVNSVDYFKQLIDTEMIYYVTHSDGQSERLVHRFMVRYVFRYEAEYLLNICGFEVDTIYGDHTKAPYGETKYPRRIDYCSPQKIIPPARLERATLGLGNQCSIHLSYGGITCDIIQTSPDVKLI